MFSNKVATEYIVTVGIRDKGRLGCPFLSKVSHLFVEELCENHYPQDFIL